MKALAVVLLAIFLTGCFATVDPYVKQRQTAIQAQYLPTLKSNYEQFIFNLTYQPQSEADSMLTSWAGAVQYKGTTREEKIFELSRYFYDRDFDTEEKQQALRQRQQYRNQLIQQWYAFADQYEYQQRQQAAFWGAVGTAVGAYYAGSSYNGGYGYYYPRGSTTTRVGNFYYTNYY